VFFVDSLLETEFFTIREVVLDPSLAALLSRPNLRAKCTYCGEEINNERQVCVDGKTLCRTCAGERYYRLR
jgi:formylmethanofuran dehydrogenase subunit E